MEISCELHDPPTLLLGKNLHRMHWAENWVAPRASLAVVVKRKILPCCKPYIESSIMAHNLITVMTELQYEQKAKKVIKQHYISKNCTISKQGNSKILHNM
jgi:hypothetical protein